MTAHKIKLLPENDNGCAWLQQLPDRNDFPILTGENHAEWVVLGAGFTGLSAARQLAILHPDAKIILLDAQRAGEGSSARNSGFLVDSTLNEGHYSAAGLEEYKQKYDLKRAGVLEVQALVEELSIDCEWNPSGKIHATAVKSHETKLHQFSKILTELNLKHQLLESDELSKRLGTSYYRLGLWTEGGVMLQPAKLARGLLDALPANVQVYENSPVVQWNKQNSVKGFQMETPNGKLTCDQIIVAVNAFMPKCNVKKYRSFSLTLTASMTRPLTDDEDESIGRPESWGILSAQSMGATVRLTEDRRILMRNTAEVWPSVNMSTNDLNNRKEIHIKGLKRRFPHFPEDIFESTWSGTISLSGNNAHVFTEVEKGLFAAGCYNASGIGSGVLFGKEIANFASGKSTEINQKILSRPGPMLLPPQPFLDYGVKIRVQRDRFIARNEN